MKVAFVLGTRPEIVKLAPVIHACLNDSTMQVRIIHTNQHFSESMDSVFFLDLWLPKPDYNLWINNLSHGAMTGRMLEAIEVILMQEKPDVLLVQWDTNTVLAGALAAVKLWIRVWHVEAGLRSYDRTMPEEHNRIITDHISDFLFAPTERQKWILISENIPESRIWVTGNTVVDSTKFSFERNQPRQQEILKAYSLDVGEYFFLTLHRPSNVDSWVILEWILDTRYWLASQQGKKVLFPIHPRTRKMVEKFSLLDKLSRFLVVDPLPYGESLCLYQAAHVIATDSGWIQEEANVLQVPTLILRENTERPETLEWGGAILAGNTAKTISEAYSILMHRDIQWLQPFGNGTAWEQITSIIRTGQ